MKFWHAVLCVLAVLAFSGTAHATNTACYDWSCNDSTHVCSFDASCSTITTGSLYQYHWDFGDGTYDNTTTATTTHTSSIAYPTVTLTVLVLSGSDAEKGCEIVVWNQVGPPLATYGRCS
jgi:hypothetical protein